MRSTYTDPVCHPEPREGSRHPEHRDGAYLVIYDNSLACARDAEILRGAQDDTPRYCFLIFLIAGILEKKNRILYFMVALLAVIAVGILIFTG